VTSVKEENSKMPLNISS